MALGWATVLLFGQVPQSKRLLLSFISLGSLAWVALLIGAIVPSVGSFLVAFAPVPREYEWLVRLGMVIGAIVLPLLIGLGGLLLMDSASRPRGVSAAKQVLRGYPYAAVLAITLLLLVVLAPIRKVRSAIKRWSDAHIPIVVRPGGYERVVDDIEAALDAAGLAIERRRAPRLVEVPAHLVGLAGGAGVRQLTPDRIVLLARPDLEVLVYPSDISLAGRKDALARARATVSAHLTFTEAYLTSSEESQKVEKRLEEIARAGGLIPARSGDVNQSAAAPEAGESLQRGHDGYDGGKAGLTGPRVADEGRVTVDLEGLTRDLREVDGVLAELDVPHDEWEVLYRLRLQIERDLLANRPRLEEGAKEEAQAEPPLEPLGRAVEAATYGTLARLTRLVTDSPPGRALLRRGDGGADPPRH